MKLLRALFDFIVFVVLLVWLWFDRARKAYGRANPSVKMWVGIACFAGAGLMLPHLLYLLTQPLLAALAGLIR
jgi:hypothetical protein